MKYLFFDTETTGTHSSARITQLAWQLYDDKTLIRERSDIIYPDGWEVPNEPFFIEHNMSTERCKREGIAIADALSYFVAAYNEAELLVAHNIDFDRRIVNYEFKLANVFPLQGIPNFCTMKSTIEFCGLPGKYGFKWPKLEELHQKLFGCKFENAHDALADITATAKCFFELQNKGIINI